MATRVTLKAINDHLARLGYMARLAKGDGYFYFHFGEAADWLDRTVDAKTLSGRTMEEWIDEFRRLQMLNQQIMGKAAPKKAPAKPLENDRHITCLVLTVPRWSRSA